MRTCTLLLLPSVLLTACPAAPEYVERATTIRWDPSDDGDFWRVPMPSDLRLQADGTFDLEEWPSGADDALVSMWLTTADQRLVGGWGVSGGVSVTLGGRLDERTLPAEPADSLLDGSAVFLVDVDPDSPERGQRIPVRAAFEASESVYAPAMHLTVYPAFGFTRRPNTTYALVYTDDLRDRGGERLGRSRAFHDAWEGQGDFAEHLVETRATLQEQGFDPDRVIGAAVFTTLDPEAQLRKLYDWTTTQPIPELAVDWQPADTFETYQVFVGRFTVPVVQNGERPYDDIGEGLIVWDGDEPVIQETQDVRLALTIPLGAMPEDGWPLTMYLHGSGGEWTQPITRDPAGLEGGPGRGPAHWLAQRGVATLGHDFPLHGDRSDPPDTTGLRLYNLLGNIEATIDNFDVAVMELFLLSRLMQTVTLDPALSGNLDPGDQALVRIDPERITGMGQSMGTTLGIPWAGLDPNVKGFVASGAGGTLVEIALQASEPFSIAPILATRLGVDEEDLGYAHPILHAFQHLWDLSDPTAKGHRLVARPWDDVPPKHVFMSAGVRDGYFAPESEAAVAVAMGLPHVGEEVEPVLPGLLELAGIEATQYPVQATVNGKTAAVIQYAAANERGHYVLFDQSEARYQYTCFLASIGSEGGALIPGPRPVGDPCP